jgi:hypothetical protein
VTVIGHKATERYLGILRGLLAAALCACCAACTSGPAVRAGRVDGPPAGEGLITIEQDGKIGLQDERGNLIIAPAYDDAGMFAEGVCPVRDGELWGYIDRTGRFAIVPQYTVAGSFSEGLAGVGDPENGVRYVDHQGRPVITLPGSRGVLAGEFHEGLAAVRSPLAGSDWEYETQYVDRQGRLQFSLRGFGGDMHEGLAVFRRRADPTTDSALLYGYVDGQGRVVIEPCFAEASDFSEGLAAARLQNTVGTLRMGDQWGYINRQGQWAIMPRFNEAGDFKDGVAWVHEGGRLVAGEDMFWDGGRWMLIAPSGKVLESRENATGR